MYCMSEFQTDRPLAAKTSVDPTNAKGSPQGPDRTQNSHDPVYSPPHRNGARQVQRRLLAEASRPYRSLQSAVQKVQEPSITSTRRSHYQRSSKLPDCTLSVPACRCWCTHLKHASHV